MILAPNKVQPGDRCILVYNMYGEWRDAYQGKRTYLCAGYIHWRSQFNPSGYFINEQNPDSKPHEYSLSRMHRIEE